MGPEKRKSEASSRQNESNKKQRQADSSGKKTSTLRDEEPAFARGGASILTPLEHRQIQNKAKQDVLFEQETGRKQAPQLDSDDDNAHNEDESDIGMEEPEKIPETLTKGSKMREKLKKRKNKKAAVVEQGLKIEGLSYRRILPGSLVLGQVSKINRYDVTLSLPNNLTGYVPLTAVSPSLTEEIERLAAGGSDGETDSSESGDIDLQALFYIGQYVRACVTSVGSAEGQVHKKNHIELSLQPDQVNVGLDATDLPMNAMVQVEVASVEDHGIVVDLGLTGGPLKGFISSKEVDPLTKSDLRKGAVMLCMVTGKSSNGKIIKLSANYQKIGNLKKGNFISESSTIDSILPGSAIEILVTEVTPAGIAGKVLGVLDATADIIHSGAAASAKPLENRYTVGSKAKARVLCTFPTSDNKKIGISLVDHVLSLSIHQPSEAQDGASPLDRLPVSTIVHEAKVAKVDPTRGLFLDLGVKGTRGFAHISRVSDEKIDILSESSGQYKLGSIHQCRVIGYNSLDGLFLVSLERKILDLPFLQLEDIEVGQVVKGVISRLVIKDTLVEGALVNVTDTISGFVPEMHLSDVRLQHPERKFKEGGSVTARVLSIDLGTRRMRLTLKKTLVNSEVSVWTSYDQLEPGMRAPGTLVNVLASGAVVQFYGSVRAFLPVSQMSETYLSDPQQHFHSGQVVNVNILSIDRGEGRMIVSCRDPDLFGPDQVKALQSLAAGLRVHGTVSEKTNDEMVVNLDSSGLRATLSVDQLVDGSSQKGSAASKRIRVGQVLQDTVVLSKDESKRLVRLTSKPSLIKAFDSGVIPKSFEEVVPGAQVTGFVRGITDTGVFVQFANEITGLILKAHLSEEAMKSPNYGLKKHQTVQATVLSLDVGKQRFLLTQKATEPIAKPLITSNSKVGQGSDLTDAVDGVSTSMDEFTLGKQTHARIVSVKDTQLNVQLANGVQGRIDVSSIFDSWDNIKDRKRPLSSFSAKQTLPVRILGVHDSKNHKFLPITHVGKAPVFELSAKPSDLQGDRLDVLTLENVEEGTSWLCFVNNIAEDCVWVNLSPNVRGRIRTIDLSDDVSLLFDVARNFPIGSAIRARVIKVDTTKNQLDLSGRTKDGALAIDSLSEGMILPAKVTKVTERYVMVQLSDTLSAPIYLVNLADDYSKADPTTYQKNQIIRVCVLRVDAPNKKLLLSARPSKALNSALPVEDREISSISNLKINDTVRGFIKHIADKGIFVSLGSDVDAFVRVSELSDAFIKDWKADYEIDRLVKGKVISVDERTGNVQLSLKQSVIDKDYKPPLTYTDLYIDQVVTGRVRKVEEFGVFVVIDHSSNVSGLCHRSEIADEAVRDVRKLYDEGDAVKARVLKIDLERRRISLGLKASYFRSENGDGSELDGDSDASGGVIVGADSEDDSDEELAGVEIEMEDIKSIGSNEDLYAKPAVIDSTKAGPLPTVFDSTVGLSAGGFDWTGELLNNESREDDMSISLDDETSENHSKKKRRKAKIKVDKTGELDANGPQSTADFERLLMGQPNSSYLWLSYMAFQLQLSEVSRARDTAERALRTINSQSRDTEEESLNVWIAYLNLENTYGTDDRIQDVFKRACEYNDAEEVHSRLVSIYIQSSKNGKADELLQAMVKKFSQNPKVWLNYATFLFDTMNEPERARELLPRALQALPKQHHLTTTSKFAQLEFGSKNGDAERGRTIFEGLIGTFPKRLDLWNVLLDLEVKAGDRDQVRRLFERVTSSISKAKKAKYFFKRWLEFEEAEGDSKSCEKVKARAAEFVRQHESS